MNLRILLIVLPAFLIISTIIINILWFIVESLIGGWVFCVITVVTSVILLWRGLKRPQSPFGQLSLQEIDIERVELQLTDGTRTVGKFYRHLTQTIETPEGKRRYPIPRPAIIFFHGFRNRKEGNEKYLIPFAQRGYIGVAFDQRGHGEAEGKKTDWFKMFEDVDPILDYVCATPDVRNGAICCAGISMGGTSVLTRAYQDDRVAMVVGMSTLHDLDVLLNHKYRFMSYGWYIRRKIAEAEKKCSLKVSAHYFLKTNPALNKGRVYLIHAKNDTIFPLKLTFELNKHQAGIPEEQTLILKKGGHGLDGQEGSIFTAILNWLRKHELMRLPSELTVIQEQNEPGNTDMKNNLNDDD